MEHHLFIICEECCKKYRVDTTRIIGSAAGFSCRSCGHRILVARPRPDGGNMAEGTVGQPAASEDGLLPSVSSTGTAGAPPPQAGPGAGVGLRLTAVLFFFVLPAVI